LSIRCCRRKPICWIRRHVFNQTLTLLDELGGESIRFLVFFQSLVDVKLSPDIESLHFRDDRVEGRDDWGKMIDVSISKVT